VLVAVKPRRRKSNVVPMRRSQGEPRHERFS
jgi:hypothetical protein